jgi:hypothetical protein
MAKIEICNPQDIEFTLTYKMKLSEWKELAEQFKTSTNAGHVAWPASKFVSAIQDMASQATKAFYPSLSE